MISFLSVALSALLVTQTAPQNNDTIVFIGDSITQAGDYVAYTEWYLFGQRPNEKYRIINSGLSSETASGTSEPGHNPPRPCIHDRFTRDVTAHKPNLVIACYGMNDGNYHPFEEERFARYQAGMKRLIDRVFTETTARGLVILTPPAFDISRSKTSDPNAKHYGYRKPAKDYDQVLRKYADWLLSIKSDKIAVLDVHRAFNRHLDREREKNPDYFLAGDAVHPGATGHWLIAQEIIRAWNLKPAWSEQKWDAAKEQSTKQEGNRWRWKSPPIARRVVLDRETPLETYRAEGAFEDYARQHCQISNLPTGKFKLVWDGQSLGEHSFLQLSQSISLPIASLEQKENDLLWRRVLARRRIITKTWLDSRSADSDDAGVKAVAAGEAKTAKLADEIEELRKPMAVEVILERASR